MSDESVRAALRSDAPLVVIEAPGGCGKTHQGADYASEVALLPGARPPLILTHTHAACSAFSQKTKGRRARVVIRTIDSLIVEITKAYHVGLGLPANVAGWVRQPGNGYEDLARKAALLMERHPMIAHSLACRYPVVICDEHQDSSGDQHAVVMAFLSQGARLRIFADPEQKIFRENAGGAHLAYEWSELKSQAQLFEELDTPHRWREGCRELGAWTLEARAALRSGGQVDLRNRPSSITVVRAENQAKRYGEYSLLPLDRRPLDSFVRPERFLPLLILTRQNKTAQSFRSLFNRSIPLWEGHTRDELEKLTESVRTSQGQPEQLAAALATFLDDIGTGFTASAFGNRLKQEAREGCRKKTHGKPEKIQAIARQLIAEPDHRGVANALQLVMEMKETDSDFSGIKIDHAIALWEAVRLSGYEQLDDGIEDLTRRRTFSRPEPPPKAISTIHKAKGLECGSAVVMPCDANTFPDTLMARRLLYVAISRAKHRLLLVVPQVDPSPLLRL